MAEYEERPIEEKTEEPTPYKIEKARKEGNVARSIELNSAVILIAFMLLFLLISNSLLKDFITSIVQIFQYPKDFTLNIQSFLLNAPKIIFHSIKIVIPFLAIIFFIAIIINFSQVGFLFTIKSLKPQSVRLNPIKGFKKFFSKNNFFELGKTFLKLFLISYIAFSTIKSSLDKLFPVADQSVYNILVFIAKIAFEIGIKCGIAILVIATIDFIYQKYEYRKKLRMTPQEIKEEQKELIGNPEIRGRIRQVQITMSRQRMMKMVPESDVVIVNPTHYAIALQYEPTTMNAPVVHAKGKLKIAEKIIEIAREYNIPVVQRPEIAQGLYKVAEIGKEIPAEFYEVIAEILAEIYKKKSLNDQI